MGRILYGVMGDARGHVARALTVAQEMPNHEILFVGSGKVHDLRHEGYVVEDIPMLSTFYKNNKVDIQSTVSNALNVLFEGSKFKRRLMDIIQDFDPDQILTDYEYFTPLAAKSLGRTCISIDHQHILTHCRYQNPPTEKLSRFLTCSVIKYLYSNCSRYFIVSFFDLPPKDNRTIVVTPPLVRKAVQMAKPSDGDHVLVYQTSPTFQKLFPVLEKIGAKFVIYGFGAQPSRKNLVFKAPSTDGFLEDLASARYAITNGGHNVLCESIYLGKPVLAFPIAKAYEQFINAYFLAQCGYGDYSTSLNPSEKLFEDFENRLDEFRKNIKRGYFLGNQQLIQFLERIIQNRS
ncbi:MAG: glycosyltransferase family protein [Desulfomonilaceae bacterium]